MTRTDRALALAALSLGFAVVQLDVSVVNVALPSIGRGLHATVTDLQWVVSAYTLAFAALLLTAGAIGDRLGARRTFVAGFALFTAASLACGLAPTLDVLIAARAVQGIGAAVLVPCSLSLLNHSYPEPRERARAVGLWAAGASVALSAGPLVGGVLTAAVSWRAIFVINLPLGAAGIVLTLRHAEETKPVRERPIDVPGQVTAIACLTALAAATIEGGARSFAAPGVLAAYAIAALAGVAFIAIERRRRQPMLPLALFRTPTFSAATAIGLLINIAFYGLIFVLSLFFQRAQHLSALQTGLAFAPTTISVTASNLLAGRLAAASSERVVAGGGALLMAVALAALLRAGPGTPYLALVGQLVALGFGIGLVVPVITSSLLGSAPRSRAGVASGTLNAARQTGSVLGVSLFGALLAGRALADGLHLALAISIGLALVVAAVAAGLRPPARPADP